MDLTDFYEPFKQLVGDYDLMERMEETARLYFNNNSINVKPRFLDRCFRMETVLFFE